MKHDALEKNVGLLMAFILVCVSIGGMVQIFPLIFEGKLSKPIETLQPLTAVQLEGRDGGDGGRGGDRERGQEHQCRAQSPQRTVGGWRGG